MIFPVADSDADREHILDTLSIYFGKNASTGAALRTTQGSRL
jgi:hypothetical protein